MNIKGKSQMENYIFNSKKLQIGGNKIIFEILNLNPNYLILSCPFKFLLFLIALLNFYFL